MSDSNEKRSSIFSNPVVAGTIITAIITGAFTLIGQLVDISNREEASVFLELTAEAARTIAAASTAFTEQTLVAIIPTATLDQGSLVQSSPTDVVYPSVTSPPPTATPSLFPSDTPTSTSTTTSSPTYTISPSSTPTATPTEEQLIATNYPIIQTDAFSGHQYAFVPSGNYNGTHVNEFWIDVYEVSNSQFAAFLNARSNRGLDGETYLNETGSGVRIRLIQGRWQVDSGYENHPVIQVTWYGARDYCEWDRIGARMPTALEWQKAAVWNPMNSTVERYPWGSGIPNSELGNFGNEQPGPVPVGSYSPEGLSSTGVADIFGNVWEWVNDGIGNNRLFLGGAWNTELQQLSINLQDRATLASSSSNTGFRCVRDTVPSG